MVAKLRATQLAPPCARPGRDSARALLVYAQALIVTAPPRRGAAPSTADYQRHVDIEAALALLSGWTGVDFSRYPQDATIDYIDTEAGRSALASFSAADPNRTMDSAAKRPDSSAWVAAARSSSAIPRQVADQLEAWLDDTGIDGFNLAFARGPRIMRDVVD